ncbi:G patch domain-containing protein 4 [Acanthosepion pharaonis]|uniref:G patch domain-containing protein 4 n=1 Tax=Acanthosepion pharaonis TaxID=158019 RepID=A0A812BID8_ACAPH|nr:G patch domain-containing protein 4 [Sepia pharaonis]
MVDSLFARYQLEKHGWTEGTGLGKHENGITAPIKVALKNNKDGVGHIPGSDLTENWWDQVYNKVASKILVKTTKDSVAVHAAETKESSKNKSLLYARFVKGATLKASEGIIVEEPEKSSESESEKEQIPPRLTDEEILKICGGRTAHKAAGHGLKQNGKLQRIQEQERQPPQTFTSGILGLVTSGYITVPSSGITYFNLIHLDDSINRPAHYSTKLLATHQSLLAVSIL